VPTVAPFAKFKVAKLKAYAWTWSGRIKIKQIFSNY
jgi:hypothetical protein